MKDREEVARAYFKRMASMGFPSDRNMVAMFIEGMREQEEASKAQVEEFEARIRELQENLRGQHEEVQRLMVEVGILYKALEKIMELHWEQEPLGDIHRVATEALSSLEEQ